MNPAAPPAHDGAPRLEPIEREELLRIARATLREYLATEMIPPGKPHRKSLHVPSAAFVTLTEADGALRGCTGVLIATKPMYRCIQECAVRSATADPRFPALTRDELDRIQIEISVLSPLFPIQPAEVVIGRHGLYVTRGRAAGVLLPQVATERGWDRETFLAQCCRKAGLDQDAWRAADTAIRAFSAVIFAE